MKIGKALSLSIIVSMLLGVVMVGPVSAPSTTIGVEPKETIDLDLVPGSTFTVNVAIRDVTDLMGHEFKLGYDTNVLTCTLVEYGGIFGEEYFPFINSIYESLGYLHYGDFIFPPTPGVGDGVAAIIHFTVDSVGQCLLELYDTILIDSEGAEIVHTPIDGYFGPLSVTLAKRKAWPEHHAYEILWDEDSSNDLFAIVKNDGILDAWVNVVFTITGPTGIPEFFETDAMLLQAGAIYGDKKDARYNTTFVPPGLGRYYVSAVCWVDMDLDTVPDTAMGTVKSTSFKVVLELIK